jgi:hypothetical protein
MVQTFIIGATSRFSALRWTAPGISGPYLTTGVDGVNLNMWTKLNGQFEQQGNTNVYEMVVYFSTHVVLYAGDLLATGTAPGVGFGKNRLMAVGDVLECSIERLGAQRREIRAYLAYSGRFQSVKISPSSSRTGGHATRPAAARVASGSPPNSGKPPGRRTLTARLRWKQS